MTYRVAGITFAHFHMGDNLRMVADHPDAEIVGICDEDPEIATLGLDETAAEFDLDDDRVFEDHERCLAETDPDLVITCPLPTEHDDWVERLAPHGVHLLVEKPMADSVAAADRMLDAVADQLLAINWPLAWYPTHRTTKRLLDEGRIGEVVEVHYYDGNRGGQRFTDVGYSADGELHFEGDMEGGGPSANVEPDDREATAWWHRPETGGGSLQDYLGYGATLGTWFRDGTLPESVTAETFTPDHLDVDTHCAAVARYETGLSKFESRWGTYTDPWVDQPQPKCGFVLVGTEGTIASYDYADAVRVQDADHPAGVDVPVDDLEAPRRDPVEYVIDRIDVGGAIDFGPLDPDLCHDAQRIVDAAAESARTGERVALEDR